ncbi:2-nitropropane dioxygenase precursor [Scopulibacillus darangshiensis]|uniref:Probable nitronate monooxygenase n=1 Tax=Scopulibacillus darangshiensis TaxID=442528 RepID=A0A4R2P897_9BACL|nr:nitronate monooxygenase family protein [Scopulibacillus darangshiensis]TCP30518.1 2-nitropropane dioxygenase precursor [Scopulibacillus darangshiensis]
MNWETRLTKLLGIKYPIIQGGLAYLAYSDLGAAVSNAGGLGQLTAMSCDSPDMLRKEIHRIRELTDMPFGVNYAIGQHGRPYLDFLHIAVEEEVPVITITGGNPAPVFDALKASKAKKLVLVSSKRQAQKAESLGADAVMVVGQEGGGHLGKEDIGTMVLTPSVADSISIPVVASGGIGDGRGLMAALALGAEGIEMGTRFIATEECTHAHSIYKQMLVDMQETDTLVIKKSLGAPARAINNSWAQKILDIEKTEGTYEALKSYISGKTNQRFVWQGETDNGFGWAGQIAGRINDIPSVADLINRIVAEAETISNKWN